ncbi:HNH endonuclease [Pseudomonas guariconensis]|uniref:HNH endonuclease n=1 Tax=Pseudomonas guariconensis TaxID=1288410 RepID=UPI000B8595DF|nr:HNH endonuclease [Pseudomonas guariconensis]
MNVQFGEKLLGRPAISAALKRAVLIEAGHRCAIPTCRHPDIEIHHIIPWETCQKHEYQNLIALCPNCHTRVHNGKIDRKSLAAYKASLIASIRNLGEAAFDHPIIEVKRRIYSVDTENSDLYFDFEFPDFAQSESIIASKNIEAWGVELLDAHNDSIKFIKKEQYNYPFMGAKLTGRYEVVRRDKHFLSVEYTINSYYGGAHGSTETRVQNFALEPFTPISLEELLKDETALTLLSKILREELLRENPNHSKDWIISGTEPTFENLSCFTIGLYTINFIFGEYQIDCYAAGISRVAIPFSKLRDIIKPEIMDALISDN